jgi:hypothetical protein
MSKIEVNEISKTSTGSEIAVTSDVALSNGLKTDTIAEKTSAAGVTIDGVLIKDGTIESTYLDVDASTTETIQTLTSSSGVLTIDMDNGKAGTITLTEDITDVDFTNVPTSGYSEFILQVTQASSASYTIDLEDMSINGGTDVAAKVATGSESTVSVENNSINRYEFRFFNAGAPQFRVFKDFVDFTSGISKTNLVLHVDASSASSYSGSGNNWQDLSGQGNHMTLNSATHTTTSGGEFTFAGTNSSYAWTSNAVITGNSARTVSWWHKGTSYIDDPAVSLGNTRNANEMWVLSLQSTGTTINVYGWTGPYDENNLALGENTRDGNWHNHTVTWDALNPGTINVYVNGSLTSTIQRSSGEAYNTSSGVTIGGNDEGADRPFAGTIGEVAIYNDALSASVINSNYIATKTRYGL